MALLNYTTKIEAVKTVNEIQSILAKHGARSILTEYDNDGLLKALSFIVVTPRGDAEIRLPTDPDAVLRVITKQNRLGKVPRTFVNKPQAVRVAWRIIKDWTEAQMAILETEMVKMEQIFLPYVVTNNGQTLFEAYESKNLLTQGKNNEEQKDGR
jgi:hypothetical protein